MPQVFGYGSLLSPASVSRTLGRPVALADLIPCAVAGYRRTWTARVPVWVGPAGEPADALFLDLTRSPGDTCNGILLTASEAELALLDTREPGYERRAVSAMVGDGVVEAVAYVVPDAAKTHAGRVLHDYARLVEQALLAYPDAFARAFHASTDALPEPLLTGAYRFSPTPSRS